MLSTFSSSTSTAPKWMEDLSENIEPILKSAREIDKRRKDFRKAYTNWLRINHDTISTVTKIRDKIVNENRTNNYFQVGGASGTIAGGILGIIGAVAAIPTGGTSLLVVGGVLAATGAVTSVGSSIKRNVATEKLCKQAVENLETNKEHTNLFAEECKSYFDALETFDSFFKTISGNDVALSLFYEFADEEGFGFLDDLRLDRWSKNKVSRALQEIVESDVTKLVPEMWSVEFLRFCDSKMKSLGDKIRNMLRQLKEYIESDPYLSDLFRNKIRNFLIDKLRNAHKPEFKTVLQILTTCGLGSTARIGVNASNLNIKLMREEMSKAIRVGLVVLNTVVIVLGVVDLVKTFINLENGSKSDESKTITEVIEDLKIVRKDIRDQMEKNFKW